MKRFLAGFFFLVCGVTLLWNCDSHGVFGRFSSTVPGDFSEAGGGGFSCVTSSGTKTCVDTNDDGTPDQTDDGDPFVPNQPPDPAPFNLSNCEIKYPFSSSNPKTSVDFNESKILAAYSPAGKIKAVPGLWIRAYYGDEHAMTLGVRQIKIVTDTTTTTKNYPVSPLSASPSSQPDPDIGANGTTVETAGTDEAGRPMYPALFVTDITTDANSLSGDWQYGGTPIEPHAIWGTWKSSVRTVDKTGSTPDVSVDTDSTNPAKNYWNFDGTITDPDATYQGKKSEGFSTEVGWKVSSLKLKSGHKYRLQFMIHDGDHSSDVGQNCVNISMP